MFSLIALAFVCWKSYEKRSLLNPHLIYWGVTVYTVYIPSLSSSSVLRDDYIFNMIFMFGNLGAVLALVLVPIRPAVLYSPYKNVVTHPIILLLACVYGFYLASTVINLIVSYGGVLPALVISRLDEYLEGGIKKGAGWGLLFLLPEICYYLFIAKSVNSGRLASAIFFTSLIVVFYVFTSNTRLPIIFPIIILVTIYIHKYHADAIRRIFPGAIVSGVVGIMIFSVVGSYLRNGQLGNMDLTVDSFVEQLSERRSNQLGYYDWIYDLKLGLDTGAFDYEYGVGVFYYPIISFIPRSVWHDKPNTSSSNRLTELVYDREIGDGQPIFTFHVIGDGYYQFSYAGAALYPFWFIWLVARLQLIVARYAPNGEYWQVYVLVSSLPFVRAELPVVLFMLTCLMCYIVNTIQKLSVKR